MLAQAVPAPKARNERKSQLLDEIYSVCQGPQTKSGARRSKSTLDEYLEAITELEEEESRQR